MITYFYDESKEHRSEVLEPLVAYNITFTGDRPHDERYFYVFDEKKLVGAIYTGFGWDWVNIDRLFYKDSSILEYLLSEVGKYYIGRAVGIKYDGNKLTVINDLKKVGFNIDGVEEATPLMKEFYHLSTNLFDYSSSLEHKVISTNKVDEAFDSELPEKEKFEIKDIVIIAKEDDKFVGGVHAEITKDTMYVSLLVVSEKYKGKGIGTSLMDKVEEYALQKGVISVNLGTCEFQAKPFYLKRGYKVVATLKDYPKGYEEYSLIKRIG